MGKVKKGVLALVLFLIFIFMFTAVYAAEPMCNCKPLTYRFTLKNTEDFSETYGLSADKFSDYVSFKQDKLILGSGEKGSISVFMDLPCDVTGEHTVNVMVKGEKSKKTSKIPIELNLVSCYGYDVKLGEAFLITGEKGKITFEEHEGNYSVCKGDKKAIPVLITNKGIENQYSFDVEGETWAKLSGKGIKLAKNQRGVVYLSLLPPEEMEGKFQFKLNVANEIGKIEKSIPINVDLEKCYGIDISLSNKEDALCGCELKKYELIVNNIGKYNDSFDFITEPYWASLDLEESIGLDASEIISLNLSVEPPCKNLKTTEIKVTGFLRNRPEIKDSESLKLDFLQKDECYGAKIIADNSIGIDYDTFSVPFKIKNEGGKETDYSISLDAPGWVSSEIESVTLKPKDTVELNLIIYLNKTIIEDDYAVRINLGSEDYEQSKVIVLRLREDLVFKNINKFIGDYSYYIIAGVLLIVALIVVLSLKKIRPEKKIKRERKKKKWLFYTILILILLAIIGAIIYLLYKFSLFSKIGLFLFWYQYYIYTLVVLIAILALIIRSFIKRKKRKIRKKEAKKEAKKELKPKKGPENRIRQKAKKLFGFVYTSLIGVIILGVIVYSLIKYNLFVREFIMTYLYYIIFGFALLIILMLIIRFNKWITELFLGERKKRKR